MATEIKVPTLGESVSEATVAQWLKQPGDAVAADEPVVELETDKVTLEVNAPSAGVLQEISVQEGENVEVGALLGTIGEGEGAAPAPKEESKAEEAPAEKEEPKAEAPAPSGGGETVEITVPALGGRCAAGDQGRGRRDRRGRRLARYDFRWWFRGRGRSTDGSGA